MIMIGGSHNGENAPDWAVGMESFRMEKRRDPQSAPPLPGDIPPKFFYVETYVARRILIDNRYHFDAFVNSETDDAEVERLMRATETLRRAQDGAV